jgi:hypothetical protein
MVLSMSTGVTESDREPAVDKDSHDEGKTKRSRKRARSLGRCQHWKTQPRLPGYWRIKTSLNKLRLSAKRDENGKRGTKTVIGGPAEGRGQVTKYFFITGSDYSPQFGDRDSYPIYLPTLPASTTLESTVIRVPR